jgi:hypothetical protein
MIRPGFSLLYLGLCRILGFAVSSRRTGCKGYLAAYPSHLRVRRTCVDGDPLQSRSRNRRYEISDSACPRRIQLLALSGPIMLIRVRTVFGYPIFRGVNEEGSNECNELDDDT